MERTNLWTPSGEMRDEMDWEIGVDIYTLLILCVKYLTNGNLLYRSENSYSGLCGDLYRKVRLFFWSCFEAYRLLASRSGMESLLRSLEA